MSAPPSTTRRRPWQTPRFLCAATVIALLVLTGCEERRVVRDSWSGLRNLADTNAPRNPARLEDKPQRARASWAVLVQGFDGRQRTEQARELIKRLDQLVLPGELWMEDTSGHARVFLGRFTDPSDPHAKDTLELVRQTMIGEEQPFRSAAIVAIGDTAGAASNPFDLKQFQGMYSLQIGYYDAQFGSNYRQAAEQAVKALRDDGHEAYFYHGPNVSMITIGLFTEEDSLSIATPTHDGRLAYQTQYSERVQKVRKQFPHNLANGRTVVQRTTDGQDMGAQPSYLVRVF